MTGIAVAEPDNAMDGPAIAVAYGYDWQDPLTKEYPFRNKSKTTFASGNRIFTLDYVLENGSCQPISDVCAIFVFLHEQ